jgi:hypothetical protein
MPVQSVKQPVVANGLSMRIVSVPASAGFPSPAGDDLEDEIDPMAWVVRHPASTFWWRVEGDCLWDVGIGPQVFGHCNPGEETTVTVQKVLHLTRHDSLHPVTRFVTARRTKPHIVKGFQ